MADTNIEYLTKSWNPIQSKIKGVSGNGYHCTRIDNGCKFCWAEGMNNRFGNKLPFTNEKFEYEIKVKELLKPFSWRNHQRVGVQFMGDLFHKDIPFKLVNKVFDIMATELVLRNGKAAEREGEEAFRGVTKHDYMILTKRPERILEFFEWIKENGDSDEPLAYTLFENEEFPHNIWFGTSVSDQESADKRIPFLPKLKSLFPTAKIWVSAEPLLGEIDLRIIPGLDKQYGCGGQHHGIGTIDCPRELHHHHDERCKSPLDWVIVGGESGHKARPMHPAWVRKIRDDCKAAGIPFMFKQWGEWLPGEKTFGTDTPYFRCDNHEIYMGAGRVARDNFGTHPDKNSGHLVTLKIGKKNAGRLLDGVLHNEFPKGVL